MSVRYSDYPEVYVHITDNIEGLIALAFNGYDFARHASRKLLDLKECWTECRYWMLVSALQRQDARAARMYLADWPAQDRKPTASISRFIPGSHYYACGVKFHTFEDAKRHLESRGYRYGGLIEKVAYPEGD